MRQSNADAGTTSPRSIIHKKDEILLLSGIKSKTALAMKNDIFSRSNNRGKTGSLGKFDPLLRNTILQRRIKTKGTIRSSFTSDRIDSSPKVDNSVIKYISKGFEKEAANPFSELRRSKSEGIRNSSFAFDTMSNSLSPQRYDLLPKEVTPSMIMRSRSAVYRSVPKSREACVCEPRFSFLTNKPSPTSFLNDYDNLVLRTSEQEPALHQMELPQASELLSEMQLCTLLDTSRFIDTNFDFASLVNVSNFSLKKFASLGKTTRETAALKAKHRPIIKRLLENGEGITVEGYIAENSEIIVFEVPSCSKIVVVFRGTNEQQAKPVAPKIRRFHQVIKTNLRSDHIYPVFRDAYFELESKLLTLVDKLTEINPFAQVVFCGHSFGGALATIAGVRYASNRPTMRVSAHVFGCPKVGQISFRQLANSLSNLRVVRVEKKNDAVVETPIDSKWHHVGHSITIGTKGVVKAYRFDRNKPAIHSIFRKKSIRDSIAYCHSLETCAVKKIWIEAFSGEDVGNGVRGKDDEKRQMV